MSREMEHAAARSLFEDYARRPEGYWPPAPDSGEHRQVRKLKRSMQAATAARGMDTNAVIEWIIALALARSADRPPPVYVMGLGGSGSQWLAEMLAELLPAFYTTEVYIPPSLRERMEDLPRDQRGFVVDCLHLAHLPADPRWLELSDNELVAASAVNAAAGVVHARHKEWDPECFVVHMVRDPRDQVISVTFRKRNYRREIARDASDEEYLVRNAAAAVRGYNAWRRSPIGADFVCRYEELRESTVDTLESLLSVHGKPVEPARIAEVARYHDATLMQQGTVSPRGNFYIDDGARPEPSDRQRALLHSELVEIRTAANYPADECLGLALRPPSQARGERKLRFHAGEDLGALFIRDDASAKASSWRYLGPASGEVTVPAGVEVKLRVRQGASTASIESLRTLPANGLDSLCLAGTETLDDGLLGVIADSLSGLRELDLSRTKISDEGVGRLKSLHDLRGVNLIGAEISERCTQNLPRKNPPLMVIA
jgi:hypothetical protein